VSVTVLGATGVIGRTLVPLLARDGEVVAVSRHPDKPSHRAVRTVAADVTDAAQVRQALEGSDVVYYLVHSLGSPEFAERDLAAASAVAREAERAGVAQIVYLGGLGDDGDELSPHLRSRMATARALESGSVPVTTLRAAVVVGPGSAGFETIVALVDRLPAMIAPRWVSTPTQPVALDDVVRFLAGVARHPDAIADSFDVGGPEIVTYRQMIETVARLRGRRPLIVEVPLLTPRLSSYWLHLVTPVRAGVARPLVEGLRNPTVARDDRIRELVRFPLTPLEDAVRAALARG
jgi:uncharacterized protein YbjT (DUF2867 family)